jgi:hypothetical protein
MNIYKTIKLALMSIALTFNVSAQTFGDSNPPGSTYPMVNECKNPDPYMPYPAECLYNKAQSNNAQILGGFDSFGSKYPLVNECENPNPFMPYPAECLYN